MLPSSKRSILFISFFLFSFIHVSAQDSKLKTHSLVRSIKVLLPSQCGQVLKNIATVFNQRIKERCIAINKNNSELKVELQIKPGIGAEGFTIASGRKGIIKIIGNDQRGVLFGVGKFLHNSIYQKGGFAPGKWRGTSIPQKPIRGMYFATHFYNFYQTAPISEVNRYIEELGLWGINNFLFIPSEEENSDKRLKEFMKTAKGLGLGVGLLVEGNEGDTNSPVELRADPSGGRGGIVPSYICPNKPGGMEYILKIMAEHFDQYLDIHPDYLCIWPYDAGGCGTIDCQPWGSNGFVKCAKAISKLARAKFPSVKIILSTWYFDSTEWKGISDTLERDDSWVNMILAEKSEGEYKGIYGAAPANLPMVGFPEISMYNTFPWGGFGATPLPSHVLGQWQKVKNELVGGFPYSEGIFDDITKVVYTQLYWNSSTSVDETLKEYIAYEYSPGVVDSILKVIKILEQNHHMRWWPGELDGVKLTMNWFPSKGVKPQADPGAEEAYAIVKQTDAKLPQWARESWRWRILYIRAMLDAELKANGGSPNAACINGFKELMRIYHTTDKTDPVVKPPLNLEPK